jgi:hypothetical protein
MKYIIIAGILIIAAFLVVLHFIPLGIEPLTELYFENHTKLPAKAFVNTTYNFSFTTHNLEYQDVEYNYAINAYDTNDTQLFEIEHGSFTLSNNESKTIESDFIFPEHFERAEIQVFISKNLIGTPEFKRRLWWPDPNYAMSVDIHFWVDEDKGMVIVYIPE